MNRSRFVEMNGFAKNQAAGLFACVMANNEFTLIGGVAIALFDKVIITETKPL